MLSDPDQTHVREALQAVEFLVVQDMFVNETAELADVVLPAVSFAEKSGTFTNTERRVHLVRKAIEPRTAALTDWDILTRLANEMGAGWSYTTPSEIFDEMAALTPQYAGISHGRLEGGGIQWPCPTSDHPGTPILHVGKFTRGLGLFSVVDFQEAAELPSDEFPLILSTGRVLFHWHGGTMSRRSPVLDSLAPVAEVEIHPADAEKYAIQDGGMVRVVSPRGAVEARALVTQRSPQGTVFMTFHFAEAAANLLTPKNIDPVAKIPEYKVSAVRIEPVHELAQS